MTDFPSSCVEQRRSDEEASEPTPVEPGGDSMPFVHRQEVEHRSTHQTREDPQLKHIRKSLWGATHCTRFLIKIRKISPARCFFKGLSIFFLSVCFIHSLCCSRGRGLQQIKTNYSLNHRLWLSASIIYK